MDVTERDGGEDPKTLVSGLLSNILTLSLLIIKQDKWALKTKAGENLKKRSVSKVVEALFPPGDLEDEHMDYDMDELQAETSNGSTMEETPVSRIEPTEEQKERDYWNLTRFLLSQERARLCNWGFDFVEQELDGLSASDKSLVAFSLVRIGEALCDEAGKFLASFKWHPVSGD